jgi:chromosome segregation ATPase
MRANCCQREGISAMNNKLQNLLILFAFTLCVLIAFQWHREARSVQRIQTLTDTLHDRDETIQSQNGTIQRHEAEILRLDGLKNQLNDAIKTNKAQITQLTDDLRKSDLEGERLSKQMDVYKQALDTANANLKKQNESIAMQNEEMKNLANERNEIVLKLNKMTEDYNNLVKKWNELVEQVSKASTNAPPAGN